MRKSHLQQIIINMIKAKFSTLTGIFIMLLSFTLPAYAQQNNPLVNSGDLLKKGMEFHDDGKYKEAIAQYSRISRSDTNYSDALYETSLSCYSDSQMNKALEYATLGLKLFPQDYSRFSMLAANALDELKRQNEALVYYDSALQRDPQSAILYFNKGVTMFQLERWEEAQRSLEQGLLINPYHASSHFFLGNIYFKKGNLVPAMLAYKTYLMLAPKGKYLSRIITLLSGIAKVSDDVLELTKNKKSGGPDNFDFVQQILLSKVALDKQYTLQASLEDNIVRQIQVVDEKLEYKRSDTGFAMQFYAPLYIKIFRDGDFEAMIFSIFAGLKLEKVEKWNKDHKKETDKFATNAANYLNQVKFTRLKMEPDRANAKISYVYEKGKFVGSGQSSSKENIVLYGKWNFYYDNGQLRSTGVFNENEEKTGEWNYYYEDGILKERINFRNNIKDGVAEGWYTNGVKMYTERLKEGKLNGMQYIYYFNGLMKESVNYADDKKEGIQKNYSKEGALVSESAYKNDLKEGMTTFYYPDGKKQDELMYREDKAQGTYKSYFESGKLMSQGEFTDNLRQGLWITYYDNGQIKEKTTYKDDDITGEFTEYYDNGVLSSKGSYAKKKIDGKYENFDTDGKLFSDATYDRGRLKEINFYDKTGKLISNTGTRKGAANIAFYSPEGFKTGEGYFNRDGNKDGKYTSYYFSGKLSEETDYKDGEQDGPHTSYYYNGQKKVENTYVNGQEKGYTRGYFFNGKLNYEGWVIEDNKQQQILFYNPLGDLTSSEYYLDNELDGYTEYFYPGKIRDVDYRYRNGWIQEIIQYDSTGKIVQTNTFKQGNGEFRFIHYNGRIQAEGSYRNYMLNGSFKKYYFDGTPQSVSYYKNDKLDSIYVEYYFGGIKKGEGRYKSGKKDGIWKYYFPNGAMSEEETYANGMLNGVDKMYNEDGSWDKILNFKDNEFDGEYRVYGEKNQLGLVLNYKLGMVISYTYEDKNGKYAAPIPLKGNSGRVAAYYRNGTPSTDFSFSDNEVQGPYKFYFSDGKTYVEGKREYGYYDGLRKVYHPNGKLWKEENYVLGNLHGKVKKYHPNGNLQADENFYNNDYHGVNTYFDEQGKQKRKLIYYFDNLISAAQ